MNGEKGGDKTVSSGAHSQSHAFLNVEITSNGVQQAINPSEFAQSEESGLSRATHVIAYRPDQQQTEVSKDWTQLSGSINHSVLIQNKQNLRKTQRLNEGRCDAKLRQHLHQEMAHVSMEPQTQLAIREVDKQIKSEDLALCSF